MPIDSNMAKSASHAFRHKDTVLTRIAHGEQVVSEDIRGRSHISDSADDLAVHERLQIEGVIQEVPDELLESSRQATRN